MYRRREDPTGKIIAGIFVLFAVAVLLYLGGYKKFKLYSRPVLTVTVSETIDTDVKRTIEKTVMAYAVTDSSAFKAVKLNTAGVLQFTDFQVKEGKSKVRKMEEALTVVSMSFIVYGEAYTEGDTLQPVKKRLRRRTRYYAQKFNPKKHAGIVEKMVKTAIMMAEHAATKQK